MTFKASIDGTPKYGDDVPESDNAEEVTISTKHTTYTLWTNGDDLVILFSGNGLRSVVFENSKQIRLETK